MQNIENNAHLGMISMFGGWEGGGHTEHRNHAQMGMVSMFGTVDTGRALKMCPSGHFFDVQWVKKGGQMPSIKTMPR